MKWVCVTRDQEGPVHGASYRYMEETVEAKAERLDVNRRHAVFEAIREKARWDPSLDIDDLQLVTAEFFHRLQ
jgi:hypothetical protein